MKKPTSLQAFDAFYAIAAKDGSEDALFGDTIKIARDAFERTLIGGNYPSVYFEFPLLGEPSFDFLTVHGEVEPGARFAPGAGYGHQAMFDWFAAACSNINGVGCGLEVDTSTGETHTCGVYLQYRDHTELVVPFLESVGESERAQSYLDVFERMPEGWPPAYVGLFPGRPGTPLRIGGYLGGRELTHCASSVAYLRERFQTIGFTAFTDEMLSRCCEFMAIAKQVDFQFDIMQDGSLGNVFGLSLSFNETRPREARECMETGYGAQVMETLQRWGLVDDRWRLIADAAFAKHLPIERDDGSLGRFVLAVKFNYAKVKFKDGVAQPAKFYLTCSAGELEDKDV